MGRLAGAGLAGADLAGVGLAGAGLAGAGLAGAGFSCRAFSFIWPDWRRLWADEVYPAGMLTRHFVVGGSTWPRPSCFRFCALLGGTDFRGVDLRGAVCGVTLCGEPGCGAPGCGEVDCRTPE